MKYDPDIHHRRSIRLRKFDYSSAGAYFVTTCAQGRECLFGEVVNEAIILSSPGHMVSDWWLKLPGKFPGVALDEYMIMPNHFHGIICIVGAATCGRPGFDFTAPCGCQSTTGQPHGDCPYDVSTPGHPHGGEKSGHPHGGRESGHPHGGAPTLGDVMDWFKTMTTNAYIRGVKQSDWTPFYGRLWQRNYYERVIRDERELDAARKYIAENPIKWDQDKENPVNTPDPAKIVSP